MSGDAGLLDNYTPTLSPVPSILFENILLELYGEHLVSSDHQFGFNRKQYCPSAICVLDNWMNSLTVDQVMFI